MALQGSLGIQAELIGGFAGAQSPAWKVLRVLCSSVRVGWQLPLAQILTDP